jgi:hypothetical protein
MVSKKKLHLLNPQKEKLILEVQQTKRKKTQITINQRSCENLLREKLSRKISGTLMGLWLLIPEHLKLGSWDLLKTYTHSRNNAAIEPRMGMQLIHEAALCLQGIRRKRSCAHQGFEILNGLPDIITDEQAHMFLNQKTIHQSKHMQVNLARVRYTNHHFESGLINIDPHRIVTHSQRIMPKKKKRPDQPSQKMLQTYFALDPLSGQPIVSTIGSSAARTSNVTIELLQMISQVLDTRKLIMADSEHFTLQLADFIKNQTQFDFLMPLPIIPKVSQLFDKLSFQTHWAGYATAVCDYNFRDDNQKYFLIIQRSGEAKYYYKPFLTSNASNVLEQLTTCYPQRWTIEEFFNFEGKLGWHRASTMNLNIRYAKQSLALIAQSLIYEFRKLLPEPYKHWTAQTIASEIFTRFDGDIKVTADKIIATFYGVPENLNLKMHYQNIAQKLAHQKIDPRVPWLYDYKIDFRFK